MASEGFSNCFGAVMSSQSPLHFGALSGSFSASSLPGGSFSSHQSSTRPSWPPPSTDQGLPDSLFNDITFNKSAEFISRGRTSSPQHFQLESNDFVAAKRTRSTLFVPPTSVSFQSSHSIESDDMGEAEKRAKRLARFNAELSQPVPRLATAEDQMSIDEKKFSCLHADDSTVLPNGCASGDHEDSRPSTAIVGLCQDMCPESERGERERKGDLDRYERLDGDRNQTTKYLAVKKYNRTAEREAALIRPMPVLRMTIDYLLGLLDRPYDDNFLGIYNFLWDRMRAVRTDLRMQHLFNQEAITLLQQMVRLHIIAMHELCEYTKGEGFLEGFDAHLNIDQMNKASAELFQMYDDHLKQGIAVPTEKEFRGYYALLKLDKHPGYNVEPAELSLDLARLTPDLRRTPEIYFARNVARACRMDNFILFFRLAKSASYLQACLMHAHFSKLRTHALASLHSGLQSNQGIPVQHVVNWLGMEEEDIESLLEFHGFSIKVFDVPYMVKEGPFLNRNKNYPSKCSKLVNSKKSEMIVEDVLLVKPSSLSSKADANIHKLIGPSQNTSIAEMDGDAFEAVPMFEEPYQAIEKSENDSQTIDFLCKAKVHYSSPTKLQNMGDLAVNNCDVRLNDSAAKQPSTSSESKLLSQAENIVQILQSKNLHTPLREMVHQTSLVRHSTVEAPTECSSSPLVEVAHQMSFRAPLQVDILEKVPSNAMTAESVLSGDDVFNNSKDEMLCTHDQKEVARAKYKLILRIWRRRSSKLRAIRELHQLTANAALSSLSAGPPIQWNKRTKLSGHFEELNLECVLNERLNKYQKSWSRINVAELVGPALLERNSKAVCLCWKLITCSQLNRSTDSNCSLAVRWLHAKLRCEDDDDLVVSSSELSIWKYWIPHQAGRDQTCCLTVIRDAHFNNNNHIEATSTVGASAILFLALDDLPWDLQKFHLCTLVCALPPGARLPLLVLVSGWNEEGVADPVAIITKRLGLHELDQNRINCFLVVFLSEGAVGLLPTGFFSDNCLRNGLQWLANHSPPQPVLLEVKVRELVVHCLASVMDDWNTDLSTAMDPFKCISAFNAALDCAVEEIINARDANCTGWPCPEIELLGVLSENSVKSLLPDVGWSADSRIMATIGRIKECKLSPLCENLSWLSKGSFGEAIWHQKMALQKILIKYLTEASRILPTELAERETEVMLQRSAVIELNGCDYHIIPQWRKIFCRIYNWRLETLVTGEFSLAYVLEDKWSCLGSHGKIQGAAMPYQRWVSDAGMLDFSDLCSPVVVQPSLSEMVDVVCEIPPMWPSRSVAAHSSRQAHTVAACRETSLYNPANDSERVNYSVVTENSDQCVVTEKIKVGQAEVTDSLDTLLERCNILQDKIAQKLAIYF